MNAAASETTPIASPQVSPVLSAGFRWYTRRYLRKNFHAVRVAGIENANGIPAECSLLCYVNHPSWWDPLLAVLITESLLAPRQFYAPIDSDALAKYRVFRRLGFYGLESERTSGAKRFLSITREVLSQGSSAVWLTPGGKFQDVRKRTTFQPGLGHLAAGLAKSVDSAESLHGIVILPVAFEYPFWQERTPEALVQLGEPIALAAQVAANKTDWQSLLENRLADLQTELAAKAVAQNDGEFCTILDGTVGVGGVYDLLRRVTAAFRRKPFDASHSGESVR